MSLTIWPAIDLLDGAAVRLHQGNYDEVTVYDRDPAAIARRWRDRTRHLHVVDLDGARRADAERASLLHERHEGPLGRRIRGVRPVGARASKGADYSM